MADVVLMTVGFVGLIILILLTICCVKSCLFCRKKLKKRREIDVEATETTPLLQNESTSYQPPLTSIDEGNHLYRNIKHLQNLNIISDPESGIVDAEVEIFLNESKNEFLLAQKSYLAENIQIDTSIMDVIINSYPENQKLQREIEGNFELFPFL